MRHVEYALIAAFFGITLWLLRIRLSLPIEILLGDDASYYSAAAVHLVRHGLYSIDGRTLTTYREPGYSFFMASVYFVFGVRNVGAVLLLQSILHAGASLLFFRRIRSAISPFVAYITLAFLLLSPAIYHVVLSPLRESIVLTSFLLLSTYYLRLRQMPSWKNGLVVGICLIPIVLTYFTFIFFPFVLLLVFMIERLPSRYWLPIFLLPLTASLLWATHNYLQGGRFIVTDAHVSSSLLFTKAEKARRFTLIDPFQCLWDEYITHDLDKMSPTCRGKEIPHDPVAEKRILGESLRTLLLSPMTPVLMLAGAIELHLPYVNGWGRIYNILEAMMTAVLYLGILLGLIRTLRREYVLFWSIIAYATLFFSFILAYPRYHLAIFLAYALLSAVGYEWLYKKCFLLFCNKGVR